MMLKLYCLVYMILTDKSNAFVLYIKFYKLIICFVAICQTNLRWGTIFYSSLPKILRFIFYNYNNFEFIIFSLGRRCVYYISTVLSVSGRVFSIFTTSHYTWFLVFTCLTSMAINSVFHSPIIIGMEISRE